MKRKTNDNKSKMIEKKVSKRVAIYLSRSWVNEDTMYSLADEICYLSGLVAQNSDWILQSYHIDIGRYNNKRNQSQFLQLLENCRKGDVDVIITESISRFCHNSIKLLETIRELKQLGVEVIFNREDVSSFNFKLEGIIEAIVADEKKQLMNNCCCDYVVRKYR